MLAAATTTRQLMSEAAPSITADPKALVSFSYISTASHPPSEDELERLLAASRSWNAQHDITGILMHNDGSFMQLLEGPREAVYQLLEQRIRPARLHHGLIELFELPLRTRAFAHWSMACRRVKGTKLPDVVHHPDHAARLTGLLEFWEMWE